MTAKATKTPAGLTLDHVVLRLGRQKLLEIDTSIPPASILTVMGESGSGKSSLLDFIAGFPQPDFTTQGTILLDGIDVTHLSANERHIGLMFQAPLLFPHMSVLENLMFALPPHLNSRKERREQAEEALEDVGLAGFGSRDPSTLSGGQQTRVALMRTLLADPKALLLDEPFSSLDQSRRADIRSLVFDFARKKKLPVLLVTHDPDDATATGGPVYRLEDGQFSNCPS